MGSMGAVLGETAGTLRAFVGLHLWGLAQGPMAPFGEIHSRASRGGVVYHSPPVPLVYVLPGWPPI